MPDIGSTQTRWSRTEVTPRDNTSRGVELWAAAEQLTTNAAAFPFPGWNRHARPATALRHGGEWLLG